MAARTSDGIGLRAKVVGSLAAPLAVAVALTVAPGAATAVSVSAGAAALSAPAPTRVVSDPRNGHHVVSHPGTQLTLALTACEDCGYSWDITRRADSRVVHFLGRSSTGSPVCVPACVGGNATEGFTFLAEHYGQTSVRLSYRGPGSTGVTRTLTVWFVVVRHGRSAAATLHLVRSGDTLYRIARTKLGAAQTPKRVRALAGRLYRDNREVIGRDRNLLIPGEVLLVDPTGISHS